MTRYFVKYSEEGNSLVASVLHTKFKWFDTAEARDSFIKERRSQNSDFVVLKYGDNAEANRMIESFKQSPMTDISGTSFDSDRSIINR